MFKTLFRTRPEKETGLAIHAAIAKAARQPALFGDNGVPDTLEGRFELVLLHTALVLTAMRSETEEYPNLVCQQVFDAMFDDFDAAMREMGVGDSGVGKKIRFMAEGFYGRASHYKDALANDDENVLDQVIARNLMGSETVDHRAKALSAYVRAAANALTKQGSSQLASGELPEFPTV
jgi:cytochrome b pre-mRNA-processing protein 3